MIAPKPPRLDLRVAALLYGAAALVLAVLIAFAAVHEVTARELARDPLSLAAEPPYLGALSQFGILAWTVGAAACLVAVLVLRGSRDRETTSFFLAGGLLTTALALDDLFQVHENASQLPSLSEPLVLAAYPLVVLGFLIVFRRARALRLVRPLLVASLLLLGLSLGLDRVDEDMLPGHAFWEDGAKFLGIAGWAATFTTAAAAYLRPADTPPAPRRRPGAARKTGRGRRPRPRSARHSVR